MSEHPDDFKAVGAHFLGPQAENSEELFKFIGVVLEEHFKGRKAYFPNDPSPITPEMKASDEFQGMSLVYCAVSSLINFLQARWRS